ncbi:MAG TPA: fumarylacetoacetase [Gemmatimonadales bacterium]|nr:fumarylacetoacetase [Gemmatimonadales bacterium]
MNETHRTDLRSWVESANQPGTPFPIQNLPFGVFGRRGVEDLPRVGVAIGDQILDVSEANGLGVFTGAALDAAYACEHPGLNPLMASDPEEVSALRAQISALLRDDGPMADRRPRLREVALIPMRDAELFLPADVGDYTDFYASIHHATNVGRMFRPDNPLLPNYKHVPIGYHGRASSLVIAGSPVIRPHGQTYDQKTATVSFGPCRMLDYECEVGAFVGPGNELGEPIPIGQAERHLFGICLVNDWSARDIQSWEYQPLGPFLAKSFATSVSPWVVTAEALEPFRIPAYKRPDEDPQPQPYLDSPVERERGGIALTLEVLLASAAMREQEIAPVRLSRASFRDMYWTLGQMIAHHTSNGCNLRPGDLLASGTVSGSEPDSRGCLLELTWRGREPLTLPTGETRNFLEDGDEVVLRGWCDTDGAAPIGLGDCSGVVLPALHPE